MSHLSLEGSLESGLSSDFVSGPCCSEQAGREQGHRVEPRQAQAQNARDTGRDPACLPGEELLFLLTSPGRKLESWGHQHL